MSWADECAERWNIAGQTPSEMEAMRSAIREAIEKAAQVAKPCCQHCDCVEEIQALAGNQ